MPVVISVSLHLVESVQIKDTEPFVQLTQGFGFMSLLKDRDNTLNRNCKKKSHMDLQIQN